MNPETEPILTEEYYENEEYEESPCLVVKDRLYILN